jgi:hypothetical protein
MRPSGSGLTCISTRRCVAICMNAKDIASIIAGMTAGLALVAYSQMPDGPAPSDITNPASPGAAVNPAPTTPPASTPPTNGGATGGATGGAIIDSSPATPTSPVPPAVPDKTVIHDPNDPADARRQGFIPTEERPATPRRPANVSPPASNGTLPPRPTNTLPGQADQQNPQTRSDTTVVIPPAPVIDSGTGLNATGSASGNLGIRDNRATGPNGATGLGASGSASGNLGINRNVAPPPSGNTGLSPTGGPTGNAGIRTNVAPPPGSGTGLNASGSGNGNLGIRR